MKDVLRRVKVDGGGEYRNKTDYRVKRKARSGRRKLMSWRRKAKKEVVRAAVEVCERMMKIRRNK